MIPTMILFGIVLGTWWRVVPLVAGAIWGVALLLDGSAEPWPDVPLGALLAAVNAGVGVLVHQLVRRLFRGARDGARTSSG